MVILSVAGFSEKERTDLSCSKSMWGREEIECALSCWLVGPAASEWRSEERARMASAAFYVAWGGDPSRMASVILIGQNI